MVNEVEKKKHPSFALANSIGGGEAETVVRKLNTSSRGNCCWGLRGGTTASKKRQVWGM